MSGRGVLKLVLQAGAFGANSIAVQIVAILLLPALAYGQFAVHYLFLGLGTAALYSILAEPFSKCSVSANDWAAYSRVLLIITGACIIAVLLTGAVLGDWAVASGMAMGVAGTVYRTGARYFRVANLTHREQGLPDVIAFATFVTAVPVLGTVVDWLIAIAWAWGISSTISALLSGMPTSISWRQLREWYAPRWVIARPLVADSALLEAASSLVPLSLAPVFGLRDFGVYRGILSAAVPVRLAVSPFRPNLARRSLSSFLSIRFILPLLVSATLLGTAIMTVLVLTAELQLLPGSTIGVLSGYAVPIGIFVATNCISTTYSILLRLHGTAGTIVWYRITQLLLAFALPVFGYVLYGIGGAVWGFVWMDLTTGLLLLALLLRRSTGEAGDA